MVATKSERGKDKRDYKTETGSRGERERWVRHKSVFTVHKDSKIARKYKIVCAYRGEIWFWEAPCPLKRSQSSRGSASQPKCVERAGLQMSLWTTDSNFVPYVNICSTSAQATLSLINMASISSFLESLWASRGSLKGRRKGGEGNTKEKIKNWRA